jgi:hypothetical protein
LQETAVPVLVIQTPLKNIKPLTIDLDIITWKGKIFCFRSMFFLLNEEIQ